MNAADYLKPSAVRETTARVFSATEKSQGYFNFHADKLDACADYVVEVIKENYPNLDIPYHSRWGHFKAGRPERLGEFFAKISDFDKTEQARIQFDLVIPSVLLDAGAGKDWMFNEAGGVSLGRSEGLGIASYYMFLDSAFANTKTELKSDSAALMKVDSEMVAKYFQVSDNNPLTGLEGRAGLVASLGKAVAENPKFFPEGRVGGLVDYLTTEFGNEIPAAKIVESILLSLGSIWPGRISKDGLNLGDAWMWNEEIVVFHKLSQWLSYSLFEPLESMGCVIKDADQMTGLAEYRNGGLFLDFGVLSLKEEELANEFHRPDSDLIIEWRAATVQLLDRIAPLVRERLNLKPENFPLAKILEGGTWWAGRKIAASKRADKTPPLKLNSDGTVF